MPKLLCSVVIPVYNGSKYLDKTIDSVLSQDYPKIELILVDDGSEDESISICEDYQHKNPNVIHVIKHLENRGFVQAFLSGVSESKGEFISVFGQDDIMLENRLSTLISGIKEHNVSMVFSNGYFLFGDEPSQCLIYPNRLHDRFIPRYSFLFGNPVLGPSALFKKNDFLSIESSIFRFKNSMEWIHWFQYTSMNGIYYLASPLLYYRRHQKNLTNVIFTTSEFKDYKKSCRQHVLSKLTISEIILAFAKHMYFKLFRGLHSKKSKINESKNLLIK